MTEAAVCSNRTSGNSGKNLVTVTNNSNARYEASFTPVKTSRVRYYVPEYSGNQVRLYDIAVYAKIKY